MAAKAKGLGRGLSALIVEADVAESTEIDVNKIDLDKTQPRKTFDEEKLQELAQSISVHGVISPIILVERGGRYRVVAGERRYRAARMAGLSAIPAVVRDFDDKQILEISIIENIQREDLNPIEEAQAIASLMKDHEYTQDDVAERLGRSRSAVANALRLLGLSAAARELVVSGKLSAGHARALLPLRDAAAMDSAAKVVIEGGLSVRQTEEYVKKLLAGKPVKKPSRKDPELALAERTMSRRFDTRVRILGTPKHGKITIEYMSEDQLQAIYDLLLGDSGI